MLRHDPYALALGHTRTMLVADLMTDEPDFHRYLCSLREIFAGAVALARSEGSEHNVTVFAWKGAGGLPSFTAMLDRARALQARHAVSLHATATRIEYGKKLNWSRYGRIE
jgi:spermidine synthase